MKYIIRDREAGNEIDEFEHIEEAKEALSNYEEQDLRNECYVPDFYEIVMEENNQNRKT